MIRRNVGAALAAVCAAQAVACSPAPAEPGEGAIEAVAQWAMPPHIDSVERGPAGLIVHGRADPGARVVLRSADGAAVAASADARGRFDIRLAPAGNVMLLTPETQRGQEASPAARRLLILDGGRGPMALLSSGGPTRRLDAAPALGAADSDGRVLILSGVAEAGDQVAAGVAGGRQGQAVAGPDGRWSLTFDASGPAGLTVGPAAFDWPGAGAAGAGPLSARRTPGGWAVDWTAPDGAALSTWLPTR